MRIQICENNIHWSKYTDFYLKKRNEIIRNYPVGKALVDVKHSIRNGRGAILLDGSDGDEVIGIGSFVLGLEEERFERKEIAVLGNCYFADSYRNTRAFIRGLQTIADQIAATGREVSEVRIPTMSDNGYTNKLYAKIADKIEAKESAFGRIHVYSTSFQAFKDYCDRFRTAESRA
jgi:hypothetical protein